MRRLFRLVLALALLVGALLGASWVGSRVALGKVVGPRPTYMGPKHWHLAYKGVEELPGRPVAWVYTYRSTEVPGLREAKVYVTLWGVLLGTEPPDLADRLERYRQANRP